MRAFALLLAAIFIGLAWLSPYHAFPWLTFSSEMFGFAAALSLLTACSQQKIQIARVQWIGFPFIFIPLIQGMFGLILNFGSALICSVYLFAFWWTVVAGYNLARTTNRAQLFLRWCVLVLVVAVISAFIAILQWLHLDNNVWGVMNARNSIRLFANFAQPNNMSTFMVMGLMACLYLFEQRRIRNTIAILIGLLLLFAIALTQSRTAWVVCLFFIGYWNYKNYKQVVRLRPIYLLGWVVAFIGIILALPTINAIIDALNVTEVVQTASAVERATTGYLRLDIWAQMFLALKQHPWIGYGWGQVSLAQLSVFNLHPSYEWVTSAHNIVLDLLVYNGLPLGLLIVAYLTCWLVWLNNKAVKTQETLIAALMVAAVLIHALLEFPLRYAYFLLPVGFLLGFIQSYVPSLKTALVPAWVGQLIVIIGCVLMLLVWRDYTIYQLNDGLASQGKAPTEKFLGSSNIYVLNQFNQRLAWLQLDPTQPLSEEQITRYGQMVMNHAAPYNLRKYAQLLVANGQDEHAQFFLFYLDRVHRQHVTLQEIRKENTAKIVAQKAHHS